MESKPSVLSQAMDYTRNPNIKAVYAIREDFKECIVQIRGMGCLVNIKGSKILQLMTCSGVLDGVAGQSLDLVMDRFTSHLLSNDVEVYRLKYRTDKKVGSFRFVPVENSFEKPDNWPSLTLRVPEEVTKDFKVITFFGNQRLTLDLTYNKSVDQHKVVCKIPYIVEKTSVQGAPIIDEQNGVVGLLQWSDDEKKFIPIFLKENILTELAQQNLAQQPTTTDGPQVGGAPFIGALPDVPNVSVQCSEDGGGAPFIGALPDVPNVSVQCSKDGGPIDGESSEEVKDGTFDLDLLPYLAYDVPEDGKWISLGRELGLGDKQIYPIQSDNRGELYEQCYRMLSEWRNAGGTFKDLAEALQRLEWKSIRQTYCLKGYSPSTKNDLQPERRWKLKKGTVQDQDIRKISYSAAVKEKRKRICRALLGVENADSHLADIAQNQDIEEQTYQIFRKWKQSKRRTFVTYQALAQALLDRTVNLDQVVTDFCTAIQGGEEN